LTGRGGVCGTRLSDRSLASRQAVFRCDRLGQVRDGNQRIKASAIRWIWPTP
jgi:hypothetical protein